MPRGQTRRCTGLEMPAGARVCHPGLRRPVGRHELGARLWRPLRLGLRRHNDPQKAAEELVDLAVKMHSSDNVTVIVVAFGLGPPPPRFSGTTPGCPR